MKQILSFTIVLLLLFARLPIQVHADAEPGYAKWGKLAVQETKKKYHADIIDYQHMGRKQITSRVSEEVFRLWMREGNSEFAVVARIRFDNRSEQLLSIKLTKMSGQQSFPFTTSSQQKIREHYHNFMGNYVDLQKLAFAIQS